MKDNPPLPAAKLAEAIRARILDGDFAPGQRLVEADLCEMFTTGRRQVREALAALTHEALVEQVPNKGARVRTVDPQEATNLSEARFVLERACLERATSRVTDGEIAALRDLAREIDAAIRSGDPLTYARLSGQLFRLYVELADQPVLSGLLDGIEARNVRYRNRIGLLPGWLKVSGPLRLEMIEALLACDTTRAVEALTLHHEEWKAALARLSDPV